MTIKFSHMGVTVQLYMSCQRECSADKSLVKMYSRENWKRDMKITTTATNSFTMFCCKGEQRYGIIAEGEYDSKKAFMLIF